VLQWCLMALGGGKRALTAVQLTLMSAVPVGERLIPSTIHLAPGLGVAPAMAAVSASARRTALIGGLAIAALTIAKIDRSALTTEDFIVQTLSLVLLTALLVFFCYVRDRHKRDLARIRWVSEAVQRVVLRPLPDRSGPVSLASAYRAADADTHLGGDFYALTRTADSTRLVIGDVRGKGLASISETAVMLESFRAAARQELTLPEMVRYMDSSVLWGMREFSRQEAGHDERFVTLAAAEIPDDQPLIRLILCGHPSPLLLHQGTARALTASDPAPPLGLGALADGSYRPEVFRYAPGDVLLLYTDGVSEARNARGTFYPLARRAAAWARCSPGQLIANIESDLRAYAPGAPTDDMAMVAVRRESLPCRHAGSLSRPDDGHAAATYAHPGRSQRGWRSPRMRGCSGRGAARSSE
jgi:serine phosphatase RsbU (regulator of sigma subunit)